MDWTLGGQSSRRDGLAVLHHLSTTPVLHHIHNPSTPSYPQHQYLIISPQPQYHYAIIITTPSYPQHQYTIISTTPILHHLTPF
ncbi:hypothetical protein Pcinc_034514 [Petrolisthes cinctipes]|uniref:Uncharacterized protein n=1 Tax=Petrolisthes cinctipes TaxID=88211 RepID=A0AAE1JWM4_PETCI|nr:hypothetical protein Pcinc_034514 [Petrolisthes cinctipes]